MKTRQGECELSTTGYSPNIGSGTEEEEQSQEVAGIQSRSLLWVAGGLSLKSSITVAYKVCMASKLESGLEVYSGSRHCDMGHSCPVDSLTVRPNAM